VRCGCAGAPHWRVAPHRQSRAPSLIFRQGGVDGPKVQDADTAEWRSPKVTLRTHWDVFTAIAVVVFVLGFLGWQVLRNGPLSPYPERTGDVTVEQRVTGCNNVDVFAFGDYWTGLPPQGWSGGAGLFTRVSRTHAVWGGVKFTGGYKTNDLPGFRS